MAKPRRHLFIQLGSYDLTELVHHLEELYAAGGPYIDLVVSFTGNKDGQLFTSRLDILDRYLPWGDRRIAANVFFGTVADYGSYGDPYGAAMTDSDFRWMLILQQRRLLAALAKRYQGKPWHLYIEHEAELGQLLASASIRSGYEAFLIQSVRDFRQMFRPTGAVAWSPAFWTTEPPPTGAQATLDVLFERIQTFAGAPGIDWILLQDMIGRPWAANLPPSVVKAWHDALGNTFRSKQVNVELFQFDGGQMIPGDADRIARYEEAYRSFGLRIGASWEMRWYLRSAPSTAAAIEADSLHQLAEIGVGASWPWLAAHNTWQSRLDQVRGWLRDGIHRGSYSRRAELAQHIGKRIRKITGLEVQGIRYMRPLNLTSGGRSSNSDHFTAGAVDIMVYPGVAAQEQWLPALYRCLDRLAERHVVRYYIARGENDAHWNHIHVSLQIGAQL